jgi:hypothetical protein
VSDPEPDGCSPLPPSAKYVHHVLDEEQLRADGGRPTEEEMLDDALFVERDEEPRLPTHTNAEEFRASFARAREASATARRERAYKFRQAQRARGSAVDGGSVLTNTTTGPGQLLVKISRH